MRTAPKTRRNRGRKRTRVISSWETITEGRHAFFREVMAAADGLRDVLCHLSAVRSSGFLHHRAADGGEVAPGAGSVEAGVSERELRQPRVPRAPAGQSFSSQQVRHLAPEEQLFSFQLGPGILHVLRQHSGHHGR